MSLIPFIPDAIFTIPAAYLIGKWVGRHRRGRS
jgi:hypothetical protein